MRGLCSACALSNKLREKLTQLAYHYGGMFIKKKYLNLIDIFLYYQ